MSLITPIETRRLGWNQRTKQLGLKQRKITHSHNMTIVKNVTHGAFLQKKNMVNVSFMETHKLGTITLVLGSGLT